MPEPPHFQPRPVTRCVCHDISFREIAGANPNSLEEIASQYGAGTGCQSCIPYLRRMLVTGETAFAVIEDDCE
jgi:bacterioferritin-associated ferredoxin